MTDPLALVALGAAIGSAAGKFTEKAWETGERWLNSFYRDHAPAAQEAASRNAAAFVYELAKRISALEEQTPTTKARVENAQADPRFSILLQRTLLDAAQTSDATKRGLLADLVANRLLADPESTLSLAISLACAAVPHTNAGQLKLLALLVVLHEVRPRTHPLSVADYHSWLEVHLRHFSEFEFREIDAKHLTALGCVTFNPTSSRSLEFLLAMKNGLRDDEFAFDFSHFKATTLGATLEIEWDLGLAGVDLTSVGSVIGGKALATVTGRSLTDPAWANAGQGA